MWLAKESVLWKRGWYTFAPVSALVLVLNLLLVVSLRFLLRKTSSDPVSRRSTRVCYISPIECYT